MNKYKGRIETSKKGFIPNILDLDGEEWASFILDHSFVEYGTGCWVDKSGDLDSIYDAQIHIFEAFNGEIPDGNYVFNSCSDYRFCFNPNCLDLGEIPEFDWTVEYPGGEDS
jgi:hypothetical protein